MKLRHWIPLVLSLGALGFLALQNKTRAASRLLPFQGRLTDAQGSPIGDGLRVVQFKIYDAPVGGSTVWSGEVQKLSVHAGLVSTLLGTKANLSNVDFDRELYLELTIDANNDGQITAADPPLLPRQNILPSVFAKEAADSRRLAGHDWTPIFGTNNPTIPLPGSKLANGSLPGSKILPASITSHQIANSTLPLSVLAKEVLDQLVPPGSITAFGGATVPDGWLLCDGTPKYRANYPKLFQAIGTAWGVGVSSGDFNVPDLRGMFLRGSGTHATQDMAAGGKFAGGTVATFQTDSYQAHWHNLATRNQHEFSAVPVAADYSLFEVSVNNEFPARGAFDSITDGAHGAPRTGSETKPASYSVLYIIKY